MLRALLWKELRQTLPIIAFVGIIETYLIGSAVVTWLPRYLPPPDYPDTVWALLFIVVPLFCGGMGIWQNARETHHGTFLFLLHRPVERTKLFAASLLIGGTICVLVGILPMCLFSVWCDAVLPRHRHGLVAGQFCAQSLVIYLGAYLSTLRPARAVGSQFFPLLAGIFAFALLLTFTTATIPTLHPTISVWWWSSLSMGVAIDAGFVLAILHVAKTRDFS